jgi:hypothetical protein
MASLFSPLSGPSQKLLWCDGQVADALAGQDSLRVVIEAQNRIRIVDEEDFRSLFASGGDVLLVPSPCRSRNANQNEHQDKADVSVDR